MLRVRVLVLLALSSYCPAQEVAEVYELPPQLVR